MIPVITSPATATGTVGTPYTYQIVATGTPTAYGCNGFPSGIPVPSSSGLITATPDTAGIFNATVAATNGSGTGTLAVVVTVFPPVSAGEAARIAFINDRYGKYLVAHPGNAQEEIYVLHQRMLAVTPTVQSNPQQTDTALLAEAIAMLTAYAAAKPNDAKYEIHRFHQRAKVLAAEIYQPTS